jgi:hypothetical protein
LNSLILNWCIGGCWFTPAQGEDLTNFEVQERKFEFPVTPEEELQQFLDSK